MGRKKYSKETLQDKPSQTKRHYDGNFKLTVVEYMHENYLSCDRTAKDFNVNASQVRKWERIYYEEGRDALFEERRGRQSGLMKRKPKKIFKPVDENLDLIDEYQRLKLENDWLKAYTKELEKKTLKKQKQSK